MSDGKIEGLSMNIEQAELAKLNAVFPQCFVEGKLDVNKLLNLCGEYVADDFEKYEFRWKGKSECVQIAGKRSAGTLRPCPSESVDFENTKNLYIEGDNLEVLKLLQTSYYRKVKMIYIDPPYNTGNDFVYADDFSDPLARYKEVTQQTTKSNPETMGRFHTNWLNMMWPRLRLAANLLRDDGVIFISIDDNEVHNLRKICDEIFGEENFIAQIIIQTATDNNPRQISTEHEYILCYAKNLDIQASWHIKSEKAQLIQTKYDELKKKYGDDINVIQTELREWIKENKDNLDKVAHYDNVDDKGVFHDGDVANTKFGGYVYDVIHPITNKVCKVPEKGYRFPKDTMDAMIINGDIMFGADETTLIKPKKRLVNAKDILRTVIYEDGRASTKTFENMLGRGIFQNPKSNTILARLINFTTIFNANDIILDFFSGSATTAHAVMQLNADGEEGNRRFILVQFPEQCDEKSEAFKAGYKNICEIGKERIRRAGAKINKGDIGFRVFKLDSSNLKTWDDSPISGENASLTLIERLNDMLEILKPERSHVEVVYEVMMKLGQDLCEPVVAIELDKERRVYGVGKDVKYIVCLEKNITVENVMLMAEYKPEKIIFADQCFGGSTENKSNVKLMLKDKGIGVRVL